MDNGTGYMDFRQLVAERYSARRFLDRPVPRQTMLDILTLAQGSASWCNTQPWQLTITCGDGTRRFREALLERVAAGTPETPDFPFPEEYLGIYRERRKACGVALYQSVGIGKEDRQGAAAQSLENFKLFGAPHVAIVTTDARLGLYGAVDCGLYLANFMLAAKSFGVDTIAQAALARHGGFIREFFGLSAERRMLCGISFGYADAEHPANRFRTERADAKEVVAWYE